MAFGRNSLILLLLVPVLLAAASTVQAGPLFPYQLGLWYENQAHDSAVPPNEWTMRLEFQDKVTIGGKEYFTVKTWRYDDPADYDEVYVRCDETDLYIYDTRLNLEVIPFKLGPIGTTWTHPKKLPEGTLGETHILIKDILAECSVPYGTFSNVYLLEEYFDPDGTAPNSPYWYEYVVPGVGMIKRIDYWQQPNPPLFHVLADMGVAPLPPSLVMLGSGLLGLVGWRKWFNG